MPRIHDRPASHAVLHRHHCYVCGEEFWEGYTPRARRPRIDKPVMQEKDIERRIKEMGVDICSEECEEWLTGEEVEDGW
jgi:predicted nucleic acid-binding Zn ribbon protein